MKPEFESQDDSDNLHHQSGKESMDMSTFIEKTEDTELSVSDIDRLDMKLRGALNRFDCPPLDTIRAYCWDDLSTAEYMAFERHMKICPLCKEEAQSVQDVLMEDWSLSEESPVLMSSLRELLERTQDVADYVRIIVANLVIPKTQMATALRSNNIPILCSNTQATLLFEAEGIDINFEIEKGEGKFCRLFGQIFAPNLGDNASMKLTPLNPDETALWTRINDTGSFAVEQLSRGEYQIIVFLNDRSIIVPNVIFQ
ncbi:hypothetical protein KFU94_64075 [Chloroflexi bacterium TSY]|nr:hypothetical protein [Chloroflexi bacterium TSY]